MDDYERAFRIIKELAKQVGITTVAVAAKEVLQPSSFRAIISDEEGLRQLVNAIKHISYNQFDGRRVGELLMQLEHYWVETYEDVLKAFLKGASAVVRAWWD
ncbi:MAG: hypothetical protein QXS76_00165 [Candidatus Bathyarchaeia archaeon]